MGAFTLEKNTRTVCRQSTTSWTTSGTPRGQSGQGHYLLLQNVPFRQKLAKMSKEELQQRFADLRQETASTQRQMKMLEEQIHVATATAKRAELTEREIVALSEDTKLYSTVGRAFLLQSRGEILGELGRVKKDASDKIDAKKQQQETVQRKLKESEEALRQLVSAK